MEPQTQYGLFIDYEWCSGCHACEIACKQEHNLALDEWGIRVVERTYKGRGDRVLIEYVPIPTDFCNFCMERVNSGKRPACVHHCMTKCMDFGLLAQMAQKAAAKRKSVIYAAT